MVYFMGGLAFLFLAAGLLMAWWVAKLKDKITESEVALMNCNSRWLEAGNQITALRNEREVLQGQLDVLRGRYNDVLSKIEAGEFCDADTIAAALRHGNY